MLTRSSCSWKRDSVSSVVRGSRDAVGDELAVELAAELDAATPVAELSV